MAVLYVKHTGSNTAPYDTWAKAATTMATAITGSANGDTIYVSSTHTESTAAALTFNPKYANNSYIAVNMLSVNDAAAPPTATAIGAAIATTGANSTFGFGTATFGGTVYWRGFNISAGDAANTARIDFGGGNRSRHIFRDCSFILNNSSVLSRFNVNNTTSTVTPVLWEICNIKFGNASQTIRIGGATFTWRGGSILSGGTSPTNLLETGVVVQTPFLIEGVDLSNAASTINLVLTSNGSPVGIFRNCKLPTSWSGSLVNASSDGSHYRIEMHNCDSTDTNYRIWIEDYLGTVKQSTAVARTGGADDGSALDFSWIVASSAYPTYTNSFRSGEIVQWNETTGSSITATVEIVTDGVTLTDAECWLDIQYLGTSGFPLSLFANDAAADVLATPVNQTTSAEAWTTTGLASPTKQKLSVTFTPQEKGFIHATVRLAKASTTVYVDPKLTVA